jgi:hypothetical protein
MKKIIGFKFNKNQLSHVGDTLRFYVEGTEGSIFSLQIKNSSGNFYNFKTKTFTAAINSENTLSNIVVYTGYNEVIKIPNVDAGDTYTFLLFTYSEFDTQISEGLSSNSYFYSASITQLQKSRVRFAASTDQTAASFVGVASYADDDGVTMMADGSTIGSSNKKISVKKTIADSGDGLALGYKYTLPSSTNLYNSLADSLQPKNGDFFTKVTGQTNGSGTDSTSMILDSVDNLVVGMSLVSIADSSDLEQSGTLGVLTYPTITAINKNTKTITLSAAPDWGDDKAVVFRAYGSNLMSKSTGGSFSFDLTVSPVTAAGNVVNNWGKAVVNGAVSGTSIAIDNINGISVGSKIIGSGVTTASNANLITAVHASGTPITVTGSQTLADNTELRIHGSSSYGLIEGTVTISTFPTADTDIFYDIDRAFILATNS